MEKAKDISTLIEDIEKIARIEKCLTCQCFYDTLLEFREVLQKHAGNKEVEERLARILEQAAVTHDCLGCDPCLPVPVSNALAEMAGKLPAASCNPAFKSPLTLVLSPRGEETKKHPRPTIKSPLPYSLSLQGRGAGVREVSQKAGVSGTPSWPIEQGDYIVGAETSPVAISTLGSDNLPKIISEKVGFNGFAIAGKTHTENIGIEKIVKNTISNPHIRFLILCGKDTKGHMAGQSIASLKDNGVSQDRKIIGSKGQRPALKNLDLSEIEHFRKQVHMINLIGTEDTELIAQQAKFCAEKNPGKFDKTVSIKKVPHKEAKEPARLVLDPSGFFIIYPKKEENKIYLEHYKTDGTLNEVIYGADPVLIASTAVEQGLVSRLDHAAYLGRELEKAYLSMLHGFPYVQDSAPGKGD